ncbi:hypothetical protein GA0061105_1434 [Rhizobium aethiopicum]|uniref:Uncharacterized protein n=1 Tax=Rhizobium aethiopicum TaxID=1138170 RepID=A0A1C3YDC4_9HYPH|nr:hypothetical protein GA0061105_1434 [Rhizobium aethiopicum]
MRLEEFPLSNTVPEPDRSLFRFGGRRARTFRVILFFVNELVPALAGAFLSGSMKLLY